jgi:hypothetical protein
MSGADRCPACAQAAFTTDARKDRMIPLIHEELVRQARHELERDLALPRLPERPPPQPARRLRARTARSLAGLAARRDRETARRRIA